jgi:hypothetical protein
MDINRLANMTEPDESFMDNVFAGERVITCTEELTRILDLFYNVQITGHFKRNYQLREDVIKTLYYRTHDWLVLNNMSDKLEPIKSAGVKYGARNDHIMLNIVFSVEFMMSFVKPVSVDFVDYWIKMTAWYGVPINEHMAKTYMIANNDTRAVDFHTAQVKLTEDIYYDEC